MDKHDTPVPDDPGAQQQVEEAAPPEPPAAPPQAAVSEPVAEVRRRPRGRSLTEPPAPWFLRKRVIFPLTFLVAVIGTIAWCWWNVPVTNSATGEVETLGDQFTRGFQNITEPKKSLETSFPGQRQISVLLVGLDHVPPTKGDPGILRRSDSVMLATTDFDTKQVRVVSIPRDGWVQHIQNGRNYGYERLGITYSLGQERDLNDPLAGITRTRESVAHLMGMDVDYYVVIEFEGLVRLVDEIGGLEVDVEMDMDYDDNAGDLHVHFKQGLQHLDGEEVVQYARFRDKKLADLGRMPRQQKVVKLLLQEMMKAKNLTKLTEIARIMAESVKTNLSLDQLLALAQHMDEYSPDAIKTLTLPSYYDRDPTMEVQLPGIPAGETRGAQCIYPKDVRAAREYLLDLAPPPPPEPEVLEGEGDGEHSSGEGEGDPVGD